MTPLPTLQESVSDSQFGVLTCERLAGTCSFMFGRSDGRAWRTYCRSFGEVRRTRAIGYRATWKPMACNPSPTVL